MRSSVEQVASSQSLSGAIAVGFPHRHVWFVSAPHPPKFVESWQVC